MLNFESTHLSFLTNFLAVIKLIDVFDGQLYWNISISPWETRRKQPIKTSSFQTITHWFIITAYSPLYGIQLFHRMRIAFLWRAWTIAVWWQCIKTAMEETIITPKMVTWCDENVWIGQFKSKLQLMVI